MLGACAALLLASTAAARGPQQEEAYRAAFSAARLGAPPPSAQLATEFTLAYRGAVPHAAFAVARDPVAGRSAWAWISGQPTPEAAQAMALERCRRALGAIQAECRILATDGEVDGAAPVARWLHPEGREMAEGDWGDEGLRLFGLDWRPPEGPRLLILLNAGDDATFRLPEGAWRLRLDSARGEPGCEEPAEGEVAIGWQSVQAYAEGPPTDLQDRASPL